MGKRFKYGESQRHATLTEIVYREERQEPHDWVAKNWTYSSGVGCGELDVIRAYGDDRYYSEVKSTHSRYNRKHAISQYHRVRDAFPQLHWHFQYVTPTYRETIR